MTSKSYWFPAKRHGWGWGLPAVWQGWVVLCLWMGLTAVGTVEVLPRHGVGRFAFIAVMVALLSLICFAKGEPPSWRWGGRDGKR
jgi:hypothetical protein